IMGHKNADPFFKDPTAINPQTGQLLNPPAAPPSPPPDPKLLAVQARAQTDAAIASHQAQLQQQKAQNDAIHLQVKTQVAPWRTGAQSPKDAIEHATVIYPPNAARLVGQHRFDGGPFVVAEFVAHDSRLRIRSLNHVSGSAIKPR